MNRKSKLMKMFWPALVALFALILAACQPGASQAPTAPAAAQPAATMPVATMASTSAATQASAGGTAVVPATGGTAAGEATLMVANDPKLGKILVDGKGMTLYMYTKDAPDQSNCAGKCLQAWPPLKTEGKPAAGDGVDASLIGTTKATDGSMMVTYNKLPLYYWASDTKPGDTTGQGVGKVWFVVSPDGKPVGNAAAGASSTSMPAATAAATAGATVEATTAATMGASSSGSAAMAGEATLMVANDPKLGKILVDGKGMTLYMYTKDAPDQSNCAGKCLQAWPPLKTEGKPAAGDGVDASLIGTTKATDGSMMVTYNKLPLYYWASDAKPGDTTGQGVGKVWYVVSPDGKPVGAPAASSTGY